jgi:hypothetical protein
VDLPRDVVVTKRRSTLFRDTLQDAVWNENPHDTLRERKITQIFLSYMDSHH